MMTTTHQACTRSRWCPVAFVALADAALRARLTTLLERAGWMVITRSMTFELVRDLAGLIEGDPGSLRPDLIVTDAHSRGCRGVTIATGLHELGISIPVVLVGDPADHLPAGPSACVVDVDRAEAVVTALATGS